MKEELKENILLTLMFIIFALLAMSTEAAAFEGIFYPPEEEKPEFKVATISEYVDYSVDSMSLEEIEGEISRLKDIQTQAHGLAEYARSLGWPEDCSAILNAKAEHLNATKGIAFYTKAYEEKKLLLEKMFWSSRSKEYPEATFIWRFLKDQGWNDYVVSGVMGNIMTEVGGNTLNINPKAKGSYYGICQWSKSYNIWGASLKKQCVFLKDTIKYELDTFGYVYKKNFNFNSFLKLTDSKQAALAFAKCYERCSSATYETRQENAVAAYNYFTN